MNTAWIIALLVDLGFQVNRHFSVLRVRNLDVMHCQRCTCFSLYGGSVNGCNTILVLRQKRKKVNMDIMLYQFCGKLTWDAGKF